MDNNESDMENKQQYFYVGVTKFCLMCICTFSFYSLYWFYKNWRYIKERDGSNIMPVWRSIFSIFWYYPLIEDVSENGRSKAHFSQFTKISLSVVYLLFGLSGYFIPDEYWYLSLLFIFLLLPIVFAIEKINSGLLLQGNLNPNTWGNYVTYFFGGGLLIVTAFALNFMTSTWVITGSELSKQELNFLVDEQLIYADEEVLYFYSDGLVSIQEDGQFITDQYVVTYQYDADDDVVYRDSVAYEYIADVSTQWSRSMYENTIVTVTDKKGDEFVLWLSNEGGGDRLLVRELLRRWNSVKNQDSQIQ